MFKYFSSFFEKKKEYFMDLELEKLNEKTKNIMDFYGLSKELNKDEQNNRYLSRIGQILTLNYMLSIENSELNSLLAQKEAIQEINPLYSELYEKYKKKFEK